MVWFDLFIPSVVLGFYHVQWFVFLIKFTKNVSRCFSVFSVLTRTDVSSSSVQGGSEVLKLKEQSVVLSL